MRSTNAPPPLTASRMRIQSVLQAAISATQLSDQTPSAVFYDLTAFEQSCTQLVRAFPPSTLHGFALKACPLVSVVRLAHQYGLGGECASIAELAVCAHADIPPQFVIYDSPAKTDAHIRHALLAGIHINADSLQEVQNIQRIRDTLPTSSSSTVGLRINPQIGSASIAETFTAGASCKFGEPLKEVGEQIKKAFVQFQHLVCIHIHVGSQGCKPDLLIECCKAAADLADEINEMAPESVKIIDLGGGLSVEYFDDDQSYTFEEHVARLIESCPNLFRYRLMTEFGRRVITKSAFIAARVQCVKKSGGKTFVICHVGADLLMRPAYQPHKWGHRIELYDQHGVQKDGALHTMDVAGPLCFAGDIIKRDAQLPMPQPGDIIVVRDCGGYTLSMFSKHTSQLMPGVYGYREDDPSQFTVLKRPETVEDVVNYWNV